MSAFNRGSLGNYSSAPLVEPEAKKTIAHVGANGNLVISSADRNTGTFLFPESQPYNNFVVQKGFPIQQGQILNVKLSEIRFPYAIPNVNETNNKLWIQVASAGFQQIAVTPGFYTGTSLAAAINALTGPLFSGQEPVLTYLNDGTFRWTAASSASTDRISLWPSYNTGDDPVYNLERPINTPSLLSVLGYNFATQDYSVSRTNQYSSVAPLIYTPFIDICSDVLTQYQDLPDSSTSLINRQHIICRLYIADETSAATLDASGDPIYPGMLPTIIHRQFKNPKVMKWNMQNSVDRIDIQLFDAWGNPLYVPSNNTSWEDFQITFQSAE